MKSTLSNEELKERDLEQEAVENLMFLKVIL